MIYFTLYSLYITSLAPGMSRQLKSAEANLAYIPFFPLHPYLIFLNLPKFTKLYIQDSLLVWVSCLAILDVISKIPESRCLTFFRHYCDNVSDILYFILITIFNPENSQWYLYYSAHFINREPKSYKGYVICPKITY